MTIRYDKAVRDKIPHIIEESGSKCEFRELGNGEFLPYLEDKLHEEIMEYYATKSMMELVDVIEIIYRIADIRKVSIDELERMRLDKKNERGGFEKNLFLATTYNEHG